MNLAVKERGGTVGVHGKTKEYGKALVALSFTEHGGLVEVYGKDGNMKADLTVAQDGNGHITVFGTSGTSRPGIDENGGIVSVYRSSKTELHQYLNADAFASGSPRYFLSCYCAEGVA